MNTSIKGFLFDLDGTLVDTAPDLCGTVQDMQRDRSLPETPFNQMQHLASGGARALLGVGFKVTPQDEIFKPLRAEFLERYEARIARESRVYDGITPLLSQIDLAGKTWAIVTNKPAYLATLLAEKLDLLERCAVLVGGDTTDEPKPSPKPCLYAANAIGLQPNECIMIGDDERDILSGKRAGMLTAAVAYGYIASKICQWNADWVFDTPSALGQLLEN